MKLPFLTSICISASGVSAAWLATLENGDGSLNGTRLPMPSKDPWMTSAPQGWERTSPGTILRIRPHAYNMSASSVKFDGYSDVFQLLFRSSDSHDQPMLGVTTVFVPQTSKAVQANSTSTIPVLSYHPPYDTACIDASPSYGLQFGEPYGEIALALKRGWFVSVPDYEGPQASYGANILAGHVILDAAQAVVSTLRHGVPTAQTPALFSNTTTHNVSIAFWGYSSGATATDFALELADTYAPALTIQGAVVGGMTANATRSCDLLSGRDVAGLLAQALLGITTQYPDEQQLLNAALWPTGVYNTTEFHSARNMSGWQSLLHFAYQDMFSYFRDGRAAVFGSEPLLTMLAREGWAGRHGTPPTRTRTFYYQAVGDEMCPSTYVDALVSKFCSNRTASSPGSLFLYQRNLVGGHNDELSNGRQRALDFVGEVLDGTATPLTAGLPATGCVVQDVTVSVNPSGPFH
ncbi:hypothetical protein SBRCBS47491_003260 [Sporothrix bragantina]|uniref:Lipase 1 n=1 Tax=Sporothrix bragantina TaxID=671064 RepID=A0ABP0BDM9_9PEZI